MRTRLADTWRLLGAAHREFVHDAGSVTAGAIAFYASLAVVPIVLLALSVAGDILGHSLETTRAAEAALRQVLPGEASTQVVSLVEATRAYSAQGRLLVNVVGFLGLFWSAINLFGLISMILTTVWAGRPKRSFFGQRLVGLLALLGAGLLFFTNMLLTSAIAALRAHEARLGAVGEYVRVLGSALPLLVSAGLAALTFFLLYRFLPGTKVSSRAALVAALPAALLWLLSRSVFSVLVAGSSRYGQLYGPLAGAVVLLLWIYYSAYIMVFCAELGAVAQQRYWPQEGARPEGSI